MKRQVEDWITFAEKDLLAVLKIVENPDLANIATFHCQQAIEKYFKAFLLEHEKPLVKTHNLLTLYGMIREIANFDFDEDLLATVNDIYLDSRYPGEVGLLDDGSMPTVEQVDQFYVFAKKVEDKIKQEILLRA
jgi:HEPN domain-containing protein